MQLKKVGSASNAYFIALCAMGAFAILSSTMSKNPVLNPFAVSLGTPTDLTGIIAAASTIPGILISLPAASLSDHIGRRKMLLFSAFIFASAPFFYLLVNNWWQLAIVRFYHGFATAIFVPVAEATVAEQSPANKGERISAFNSATYVGRGIAPFLGGAILFITNYGFHTLYFAVGVAGVTAFIICLLLSKTKSTTAPPRANITPRDMLSGWVKIAGNKGALMVSFVQAGQYYVYGTMEFYIVQYMIQVAELNALAVSVVMGLQVVSLIVARPLLGRFSDRYSRRLPIVLGCIISGALILVIPFTIEFAALLAISLGYAVGFAMVVSSTSPLMCELTPSNLIGTSMGFLSTVMDIGQALGPIVSSIILASALAYSGLFSSLTLLLVLSGLIFLASGLGNKK
jgi:MFS family permease